jgi:hypothetical protein
MKNLQVIHDHLVVQLLGNATPERKMKIYGAPGL